MTSICVVGRVARWEIGTPDIRVLGLAPCGGDRPHVLGGFYRRCGISTVGLRLAGVDLNDGGRNVVARRAWCGGRKSV